MLKPLSHQKIAQRAVCFLSVITIFIYEKGNLFLDYRYSFNVPKLKNIIQYMNYSLKYICQ